jgi:hypothetical protein
VVVALWALALGVVFTLLGLGAPSAALAASAHAYDTSTSHYDAAPNSSPAHTSEAVLVAPEVAAEGAQGTVGTATGALSALLSKSVAADSAAVDGVGATTIHGAERVAGAGATRGGVLSADQIVEVRVSGQVLTQADGATVSVLENAAGRFDIVVDGSRGLITTFNNLSASSMARLAAKYGWE